MAFERDRLYDHALCPVIPPGEQWPSVTTITGLLDKSGPLVGWAVKKEREYVREAMLDWLTRPRKIETPDTIWAEIEQLTHGIKQADKLKAEAADIGSRVHELAMGLLRYRKVLLEAERETVKTACHALIKWRDHVTYDPMDAELVVASKTHRYAGRLDHVGFVDGELTLIDLKTSNRLYPEHLLQITAYSRAYEETCPILYGASGRTIRRYLLVRLGKEQPMFEPYDVTRYREPAMRCFLGLRQAWEELRNGLKLSLEEA